MKKTRKLTKLSIKFILAFCDELRREREKEKIGKGVLEDVNKAYITQTMLSGIYNVLINEGYSKKHLDNYFFFQGEPNKHKELTEEANRFYFKDQVLYPRVRDYFYRDPRGIRLRKEIDKLSEKFNQ